MSHIVLVIENSLLMNQRSYFGLTYLDAAKAIAETILKTRPVDSDGIHYRERIHIFSTAVSDISAFSLITNSGDTVEIMSQKVKNLQCDGNGDAYDSCLDVFRFLGLYRLTTGIDTFSMGRNPNFIEPTVIILISHNILKGKTIRIGDLPIQDESYISKSICDLSEGNKEFYHQVYRWDQTLYVVDLVIPGVVYEAAVEENPPMSECPPEDDFLLHVVQETQGQWFTIHNDTSFNRFLCTFRIPLLSQNVSLPMVMIDESVYVQYENIFLDCPTKNESVYDALKMTDFDSLSKATITIPLINTLNSLYLFPEAYWVDCSDAFNIPLRDSFPVIVISNEPVEVIHCKNFPIERYKVDIRGTDLVSKEFRQGFCYQCFLPGSSKVRGSKGDSFGYVTQATKDYFYLHLLPYNYPVLIELVNDLFTDTRSRQSQIWKDRLEKYINSIPVYFYSAVRGALRKMGVSCGSLLPENIEMSQLYHTNRAIRRIKNMSKALYDSILQYHTSEDATCEDTNIPTMKSFDVPDYRTMLLKQRLAVINFENFDETLCPDIMQSVRKLKARRSLIPVQTNNLFFNSYDISRSDLIDITKQLRLLLCTNVGSNNKLIDEYTKHSVAISVMGDYRVSEQHSLRPIDPLQQRQNLFGNPFKLKQAEADIRIDEAEGANVKNSYTSFKSKHFNERRSKFLSLKADRIKKSLPKYFEENCVIDTDSEEIIEVEHETKDKPKIEGGKEFFDILREISYQLRMHTPDYEIVEELFRNNSDRVESKNFIHAVRMESMRFSRWSRIKKLIKPYYEIHDKGADYIENMM